MSTELPYLTLKSRVPVTVEVRGKAQLHKRRIGDKIYQSFMFEVIDERDKILKLLEVPPRSTMAFHQAIKEGFRRFEVESQGNRYMWLKITPIKPESLLRRVRNILVRLCHAVSAAVRSLKARFVRH